MTRNELYELLKKCGWEVTPINTLDKIWGQPFDGETEKITKKDDGLLPSREAVQYVDYILNHYSRNSHADKLCLARNLEKHGWRKKRINTTKSVSSTSPVTEQADHETAEQKVKWLTILLTTKHCDPVFADYWLRLARRNLRLGLPLTTPEPELNPSTEESSATDHFRDATKMVSRDSSAAVKESLTTQPQPIATAPSGQRILLYCQRKSTDEGWWQIGMHCPDVRRWIDDDYEPDWLLVQPSFWLPLPPQPTQPNP